MKKEELRKALEEQVAATKAAEEAEKVKAFLTKMLAGNKRRRK